VKDRGKMIEGIAKDIKIKRADEMAETGLAYRIKKKNNIIGQDKTFNAKVIVLDLEIHF
jgi:hypothetical protein